MKHKPAFIMNIVIPPGAFDINLSPDKREIVLCHEMKILDALRVKIDEIYAPSRFTFAVSQGLSTLNSYLGRQQTLDEYTSQKQCVSKELLFEYDNTSSLQDIIDDKTSLIDSPSENTALDTSDSGQMKDDANQNKGICWTTDMQTERGLSATHKTVTSKDELKFNDSSFSAVVMNESTLENSKLLSSVPTINFSKRKNYWDINPQSVLKRFKDKYSYEFGQFSGNNSASSSQDHLDFVKYDPAIKSKCSLADSPSSNSDNDANNALSRILNKQVRIMRRIFYLLLVLRHGCMSNVGFFIHASDRTV
jgi:DNA mismatch repair ATPase MutL